jgi:hypothetical protein
VKISSITSQHDWEQWHIPRGHDIMTPENTL